MGSGSSASWRDKDSIDSEVISLENIMNTYYVKDLRKKVEASITNRLKHGKVVSRITCRNANYLRPKSYKTVRLKFEGISQIKAAGTLPHRKEDQGDRKTAE